MDDLPDNLLPLIDADWLCFMACQAIEYPLDVPAEADFQEIVDVMEGRVKEICKILNTKKEPIYFFTGAANFRMDIAKAKKYKGNRTSPKPFNYRNLLTYVMARYQFVLIDNLEADDAMAMYQTEHTDTIIVTVDKDLRQVNGWQYSPEGWNYPSFGPVFVTDDNSYIKLSATKKKVLGTGYKFFYSQLITGDTVDNIPGLPGYGPAAALKVLANATTKGECYLAVRDAYRAVCWDPDVYLKEQADLLWMVRETNEGEPVLWIPPKDL